MKKNVMIGIILIISISIFLISFVLFDIKDNYFKRPEDLKSYNNIADIPQGIYIKPEFYPSYEIYKQTKDKNKTGSYGYGAYPGEISYNVTGFKVGQYLDIYTFVHSAYNVKNYQGLNISLTSPDNKLFDTYTNPSDILLSPVSLESPETTPNWTYKIKMKIIAKKDIPEGRYVFKLNAGQPSPEKELEYSNMVGNYTSGGMIQPGKFFDFLLYAYKEE